MPLRSSFRRGPSIDRRRFIGAAGAGLIGLAGAPAVLSNAFAQGRRWSGGDPFSLGVASGAPRPDGFVLWTRLAPDPLSPDPATPGGMSGGDVPVTYEIAADPAMREIVRRGAATAERTRTLLLVPLRLRRRREPGRPRNDNRAGRHGAGAHAVRFRLLLQL
jgi:phosphodiesterase/alkaline phosphatase D-like protein